MASLLMTCSASDLPNTLTDQERASGWTLLFDGTTMHGWDDPRLKSPPGDAWTIEDGCLKANAHPRITEDLFTSEKYRDFELVFDWRISPAGNSGLKYRIQSHKFIPPKPPGSGPEKFEASVERSLVSPVRPRPAHGQDYVIGFEFQLIDDAANGDAVNPKQTSGALYDMVAPSAHVTRPAGQFNHARLIVRGNHVEHWLNDVKVVDTSLDAPAVLEGIKARWGAGSRVYNLLATEPSRDCPISLQNHGDAAWFRNIKIRRIEQ